MENPTIDHNINQIVEIIYKYKQFLRKEDFKKIISICESLNKDVELYKALLRSSIMKSSVSHII